MLTVLFCPSFCQLLWEVAVALVRRIVNGSSEFKKSHSFSCFQVAKTVFFTDLPSPWDGLEMVFQQHLSSEKLLSRIGGCFVFLLVLLQSIEDLRLLLWDSAPHFCKYCASWHIPCWTWVVDQKSVRETRGKKIWDADKLVTWVRLSSKKLPVWSSQWSLSKALVQPKVLLATILILGIQMRPFWCSCKPCFFAVRNFALWKKKKKLFYWICRLPDCDKFTVSSCKTGSRKLQTAKRVGSPESFSRMVASIITEPAPFPSFSFIVHLSATDPSEPGQVLIQTNSGFCHFITYSFIHYVCYFVSLWSSVKD